MTFRNIFTGLPCLLKGMSAINIFRRTLSGGGGQQKESSLYACENVEKIEPLLKKKLPLFSVDIFMRVITSTL